MKSLTTVAATFALLSGLALPSQRATAQDGGDYLFGRPKFSLALRVGAARPDAANGVFSFSDSLLTLNPNAYTGLNLGAEIGIPLTQRVEVQLVGATSARRLQSEYRDFVDNSDLPIEQVTRLRRTPLSVGVRYNFAPAGRTISRLAWVPTRTVPYVAAGGGAMWYRFQQEGDFIDSESRNLDVFRATLSASGWAPLGYAAAGLSWSVRPTVALNTEVRYDYARAPLRGDFTGFGNTSMSGIGLTTGLQFRF
ncbi:hypothetical protein [Gemmatimonas sp.]|jgi:hypothetical protein|uniref:hypothetical protein n=1 Tax=Gemmatimonas sp. TaxID=1962908 RepID=UPI0037BFF81D